ncbi:hypothetical protein ABEB36_003527 [Hypothenemus hampei]|uniref:Uncharacterized protein n=1 Tax=Hypothenemus hampei TaxID=57062 RepID=A0ABD1F9G1_HYPHA
MIPSRALTMASQAPKLMHQCRNMSMISGPPTVKVSFAEKVIHGVLILAGISAYPSWVLVNIKNYRNRS